MPFIRFLASKCYTYIVILILLLGKIMPIYSYCTKKRLVYIIIITLCLYQFNGTSKSDPGARNTYSIVCSFGWW